ncbi:uncharacterized protein METZ01_LOCUS497391, partial [marine metagenome]
VNKKDAFAAFGVVQQNERWSWSGISNDGGTVVLTLWQDQFRFRKDEKVHYWSTFGQANEVWVDDVGNRRRIEHIQFCIDNCDGKFRGISVYPKKALLPERVIERAVPLTKLLWTIDKFDASTGECSGHSLQGPSPFV